MLLGLICFNRSSFFFNINFVFFGHYIAIIATEMPTENLIAFVMIVLLCTTVSRTNAQGEVTLLTVMHACLA